MSANFTPDLTPKQNLQPFRYWCYKILPLSYDDSLSYYELLSKVVDALNKSMEDTENVITDITNLNTAFGQLEDYVNHYFDNADIQEGINKKLDDMAASGTLSALIEPLLPQIILREVQDAIPPLVSAWMDDNITDDPTVVIDRDLSTIGAAADAFQTGYFAKSLAALNCADLMAFLLVEDETKNGVTFTFHNDGSCTVAGTATADTVKNMYFDREHLPSWLKPGDKFTAHSSIQTDVHFEIWFYKNNSYLIGWNMHNLGELAITVPADAEGMLIRLSVASGVTVNRRVTYSMIKGVENSDLSNAIIYRGAFSGSANNITQTGWYRISEMTDVPTSYGMMFHLNLTESVKMQLVFKLRGYGYYCRCYTAGQWFPWFSMEKAEREIRYLSFGASVTAGSLWNDDGHGGVTVTYAEKGYKIPDRIANIIRTSNYQNYAVGGMAFTHAASESIPKMIDYMQQPEIAADIINADLITIAGSRNDGSYPLGTYTDSTDSTICGALNNMIDYIRGLNKTCQIVVVQTTPWTEENHPWSATSSAGWSLDDVEAAWLQIARAKDVGYAGWRGCSLMHCWSDLSGAGGNYAHMKSGLSYYQMGSFIGGKVAEFYTN